ncbi:winged helix-turn-helix domain-containing protein [Rahnella laticis]|uniref:winged helix-turn-helix domain-containing protein n=1 Tax=Rahnella laticis TaxID=2787622 RepID=UPI0018A2AB38|nr:transcriptional regulator [Rahnella laticis]MBF7995260.1 transcriptional regulator [Rahnella laticis]
MEPSECTINHWRLDIASASLIHQITGEQRRLGEYQLRLLTVFIEHTGEILSRDQLTQWVWARRIIGNNSLPNAVHALRVALEDDGKQQRIIKTIPRKGYILEAEFCQPLEKAPEHLPVVAEKLQAEPEITPERLPEREETPVPVPVERAIPVTKARATASQWQKTGMIILITALTTLLLGWGWKTWLMKEDDAVVMRSIEENVYSNIRIFELADSQAFEESKDDLHFRLKNTLYRINQTLKGRSIHMQIYYHLSEMVLNYTIVLSNSCGKRQLAMNVYQWRLNADQLNSLIYRETERKLNEMDVCAS